MSNMCKLGPTSRVRKPSNIWVTALALLGKAALLLFLCSVLVQPVTAGQTPQVREGVDNRILNTRTDSVYDSINGAAQDAREGDLLLIGCGTYNERVYVTKSMTLLGADRCNNKNDVFSELPTINGNGGPAIAAINQGQLQLAVRGLRLRGNIVSEANVIEVENNQILGPGVGQGSALMSNWRPGPGTLKFNQNFVKGWQYAVQGTGFEPGAEIIGNRLRAVTNGFYLIDTPRVRIEDNYIQNYMDVESVTSIRKFISGVGIMLIRSPYARVYRNTICGMHVGICVYDGSHNAEIDLLQVSQDTDALDNEYRSALLDQLRAEGVAEERLMTEYESLARGKGGGIAVANSDDVKITRAQLCRGAYGLEINSARRVTFEDNTVMLMSIGLDITPHGAPTGDPQWALNIGRNYYGAPEGLSTDGVDDRIGQPRLVRRPRRVNVSDHHSRILNVSPHYDRSPVPMAELPAICPRPRGESGWEPPEEYDY